MILCEINSALNDLSQTVKTEIQVTNNNKARSIATINTLTGLSAQFQYLIDAINAMPEGALKDAKLLELNAHLADASALLAEIKAGVEALQTVTWVDPADK